MSVYYEHNGITIYHAAAEDVLPQIKTRFALSFTSPPYNMRTRVRNGQYTTRERGKRFSRKYTEFDDALSIDEYYGLHLGVLRQILKMSDTVFWNIQLLTGNKQAVFRILGEMFESIKDVIIWDKGNGQPAMHGDVLNKATEMIFIFEEHASAGRAFSHSRFKRGTMDDIWRISSRNVKRVYGHSAAFPVDLPLRAILNWSDVGDYVLDPFLGTGTTLVAAQMAGRHGVGIEISERYCEIAANRLRQLPLLT